MKYTPRTLRPPRLNPSARAHDKAAWEQWGEYANLNFPEEYPDHPAAKERI